MEVKFDVFVYSAAFVALLVANHVLKWALPAWILWIAGAPIIFGAVITFLVLLGTTLGIFVAKKTTTRGFR